MTTVNDNTGYSANKDEFTLMLEGMNKSELVKYGKMTYGLSLTTRYTQPDLVAAIKDAATKYKMNSQITVGKDLDQNDVPPGHAEIQLHRTELNKNEGSAIIGLNGNFASLPIGEKFWCPLEFVEILNHAQRLEYHQDWSSDPVRLVEREVHTYPYTVHRVSQHTPESFAASSRKRGFRGRKEGEAQRRREAKMSQD